MSSNTKKKPIDAKLIPFSLRERLHEFTGNEFKLWMCLYLHSDREGEAYPSNKTLMQETGLTRNTLAEAKKGLRAKGWMTSTQRYRENGTLSSMEEKLTIPKSGDIPNNRGYIPPKTGDTPPQNLGIQYPQNSGGLEVPTIEVPNTEEPTGVNFSSKKDSEQVPPSADSAASAFGEQEQDQPLSGLGTEAEQNQNQPQTFQELVDSNSYFTQPTELLFKISPNITDAMVRGQLPLCTRILEHFRVPEGFEVLAAEMVLLYNRAHRSGKYASKQDKKLYIRTASQFLKALESDSASLMNDYDAHAFDQCEVCQQNGVWHYDKLIKEVQDDRVAKEEARLRAIENAKAVAEQIAEEKAKQDRWAAYVFDKSTPEQKERLKALRTFDLTAVVKTYGDSEGRTEVSVAQAVNAAARFFADRGTPFTREEWDSVMADATEAHRSRLRAHAAAGDSL
jgi:hypothetical protein